MKIIGHRGALGLAPENTVASIKQAIKHKVDEIEFDVRVTKDNVPVLQHNSWVTSSDGKRFFIRRNTYQELVAACPDLTTLQQVFDVVDNKLPLYIEVKPGEDTQAISDLIKAYIASGGKAELLSLGSYSQRVLLALHRELPMLETIVIDNWSGVRATYRARQLNTKRISMNQRWLWSGFIKSMNRGGYKLTAFTLNDPAKAKAWESCGLYAAVTNFPDRFEK